MKLYSTADEQALRARHLLKDWTADGFLTSEQHERLKDQTVSDLRTTNLFLRLVLFFFSLICIGAAAGLFFTLFLSNQTTRVTGTVLLIFAIVCYAAAESIASGARLYRYGIEEALAACSVGFLCAGLLSAFSLYITGPGHPHFLVPAAGAVLSLWIWRRFGLWYFFLAAMIFANFLATDWTSSQTAHHVLVAAFYATGLACLARLRRRSDHAEPADSIAEALLWLGIYVTLNLKISSLPLPGYWWGGGQPPAAPFPTAFYWTTWVLIWCLPPVILARGIRLKDRFVLAAGIAAALLTLLANKPYLGWPRHTWDPMILGIFLVGAVLYLRRWLAHGPAGIRAGFTSARLSAKDSRWIHAGSAALGLLAPPSIAPGPPASSPQSAGGASGGAGASREF